MVFIAKTATNMMHKIKVIRFENGLTEYDVLLMINQFQSQYEIIKKIICLSPEILSSYQEL